MKKYSVILAFLLLALSAFAQSNLQGREDSVYLFCYFKGNGDGLHFAYSHNGYEWLAMFGDSAVVKPTVSRDRLMRDPNIIRGRDGKFHMVWTVSWNDKGIGYASSRDLVNWSAQQYLPVMAHEDSARNAWAPEITYDRKSRKYMIYWASTIRGRFPQKDTAAESDYNHRIYYVTTKNFKKFTGTYLLYDPGFSVIDASIVPDGNRFVMFLKNETRSPVEKNLRIAFAEKLTGPYSAPSAPITGNYWAEGPTALRMGSRWIVYFDKYRDRKYGAVESTDLVTWKDISGQVVFPKGIRHGSVLVVSQSEFDRMVSNYKTK